MNLLLAEQTSFLQQYGLLIALAVILIAMMVFSYLRNKKFRSAGATLISGLKLGDEVKTYSGFYGTIVDFKEVESQKTAIIKVENNGQTGLMQIDVNAVYSLVNVKPVEDEEVTEEVSEVAEVAKPVVEVKEEEVKVTPVKKVAKKPATKTTTAKKTTAKKTTK